MSYGLKRVIYNYENHLQYLLRMFDLDQHQVSSNKNLEGECFYLIDEESQRLSKNKEFIEDPDKQIVLSYLDSKASQLRMLHEQSIAKLEQMKKHLVSTKTFLSEKKDNFIRKCSFEKTTPEDQL